MKTLILTGTAGLLMMAGGCRSSEPVAAYANPVDACAAIVDLESRERCLQNVVADVVVVIKREQERRKGR